MTNSSKQKPHGGARKGAGRKHIFKGGKITFVIDQAMRNRIEAYRRKRRITRSKALRDLIARGIQAATEKLT